MFNHNAPEPEVQPDAPELEFQPNTPELDDQPNAPELEVQPNTPELEVQRHSPGMEFQPHAPEIEDQHNAPEPEVQTDAPELEVQANAPELDVQSNAPELEVQPNTPELEVQRHSYDSEIQSQSSDPEVQYQSSDPEDPSTASSRLSLYMQISPDGSVGDDNPLNCDDLQNLHCSSKPQVQCDRSNLAFPFGSDESSEDQSNSALGSSEVQSNSAFGSSADQSNSAVGSSDSRAYSSGPHSTDGSPDGCSPNLFLTPAGVFVTFEEGREYIAQFKTTADHQEYLMNMIHEIVCIGRKLEYVKNELEKRNDQSDIPWDTLTTEDTGND